MGVGGSVLLLYVLVVAAALGCRSQAKPPAADAPSPPSTVGSRAASGADTIHVPVMESALIAIADTSAISADGESGVSEDFGYYLDKATDSLRARGIVIRTHLSRRIVLQLGEHTHEWELPPGSSCGYVWIEAGASPQTAWGVLTNDELLQWTRN